MPDIRVRSTKMYRVTRYVVRLGLLWLLALSFSLAWSIYREKNMVLDLAKNSVRRVCEKDIVVRRWASGHGGVYVPVTDRTPPNPYLDSVPERDITTPLGKRLTLMNPAYISRQIHEMSQAEGGVPGHITSLNPIRPENAADPWETKALKQFVKGATEVTSVDVVDGKPYMRLMHPLVTEESCLKCHASQGYKVGDIRGGISVSEPMEPYRLAERTHLIGLVIGHGVLGLLGILGIALGSRSVYRRVQEATLAQEALRESEERFRGAFEQAAVGIVHATPLGRFLRVNQRFLDIVGYNKEDVSTLSFKDINHPDDFAVDLVYADQLLAGIIDHYSMEKRYVRKDGSLIWVRLNVNLFKEATDDPPYSVCVIEDITDRKRAEDAFQEALTFREAIIQNASEGLCVCHAVPDYPHVCFTVWNSRMVEITGYSIEEINRLGWYQSVYPDPEVREEAKARMDRMRTGDNLRMEPWEITRSDGRKRTVTISTSIISIAPDSAHVLALMLDITDQMNLEKQLLQSQKMEALGQLAGGIAHDFNNILQAILGNTQIVCIRMPADSPEQNFLKDVLKATQRASSLVRQLLAFSRWEVVKADYIDLNDLVSGLTQMVGRVIGERIELEFLPASKLKTVFVDRSQIEQVLLNLCVNARDAIPKGGKITITTANVSFDDDFVLANPWAKNGEFVELAVSDTGIGIPEQIRNRVFEPFFTTKEAGKGTGLGLSVVYGVVKRHGGFINLDSVPNQGTQFRVYFPTSAQSPDEQLITSHTASDLTGSETILLAEDDDMARTVVARNLESLGYRVLQACNGLEAVQVFEKHKDEIQLALLDVVMPGLGGSEVMKIIREARTDIPCIYATGYGVDILDESHGVADGALLIHKPYDLEDLLLKLRKTLNKT